MGNQTSQSRDAIEAVNLAAQCQGVMELISSVFQPKGLQEVSGK